MVQSRPLATQTHDDAFREIQLNGKQLVFLFMVATVVSVVIFLCGVFVGRGVRAERPATIADASASTPLTIPDVAPADQPPPPAGSDPTAAAPPPAVDELSYFNRLEKPGTPAEDLTRPPKAPSKEPATKTPAPASASDKAQVSDRSSASKASPEPRVAAAPPAAPPAPIVRTPAAAAPPATPPPVANETSAEPSGQGFALQVTALRERREADAIAKRLSSKGYAAYVLTPANGTPSVYRVRVGKFKTRREAEAMATRLQKEEQFTPWITR